MFTEFFSEALPPIGTPPPVTPEDTNQSRRLAMSGVMTKILNLSKSNKLSAQDKLKLSEHAELINKILPNLAVPTAPPVTGGLVSCSKPITPSGLNEKANATTNITQRMQILMDEVYMALSCQLTNIVTLQPYNAEPDGVMVTDGGEQNDIYHQLAGHQYDPPRYLPAKTWIMDQILYLANKMDSVVESNGLTMLDNSLIVVLSNDGMSLHSNWDWPVITFGSLGGLIKTGNYVNFQRPNAPQFTGSLDLIGGNDITGYRHEYLYNLGRPLGSLYTTILNCLGISHSGFGEYVDPDGNYSAFTTAAAKQSKLPVIT